MDRQNAPPHGSNVLFGPELVPDGCRETMTSDAAALSEFQSASLVIGLEDADAAPLVLAGTPLVGRPEIRMEAGLGVCAPSGTRTPNPLIKSQLLCQLS